MNRKNVIIRLALFIAVFGAFFFLYAKDGYADSLMSAGRAYGVYNRPGQTITTSGSSYNSDWSPKFGDFYDAYQQIKNLITGNKQDSGNNAPVGVRPTADLGIQKVTGRAGEGVGRLNGAIENADRLIDGNSRFESETADLVIDRIPAAVNFSSSVTGENTSGIVGGYVQDLTDRVDPNAVNNYTRNAGWTKTTDSWLRSTGSFGITDETKEYSDGVRIYNRDGKYAYQRYIDGRIKTDINYLNAKEKADKVRGYSSKQAVEAYYRRTYGLNTKGLEGGPNEKPNIYLYPEETTDVQVKLLDSSQITVSIPVYEENGWNVTASPDGKLVTAKGDEYGYLFYESEIHGIGFQYKEGFYLPSQNRNEAFGRILSLYGLNETEKADFKEYWSARLNPDADYYMYPQINEACDAESPFNITPVPDSVLRLWFVYKKTDNGPDLITEPKVPSFERKGFTVVEWGGMVW